LQARGVPASAPPALATPCCGGYAPPCRPGAARGRLSAVVEHIAVRGGAQGDVLHLGTQVHTSATGMRSTRPCGR
jgi:hypothetical protein